MSTPSPSDWGRFYRQNLPDKSGNMSSGGHVSEEAPVVTTTTTVAASTVATNSTGHLSPDGGRVSKPVRRRSRASRRTPTTLLNTDTTNFRAMVQQFTGGPSAPFAMEPSRLNNINPASIGFGIPPRHLLQTIPPNNPQLLASGGIFNNYNLECQQPHQQYQYHQPQLGQPQFVFSLRSNTTAPTSTSMEVSNGFGGVSSQVMPSRAPPGSSSNENKGNTFLF